MPSKKPRLRLYADECFPVTTVTFLKSLGFSIIHAYDLKFTSKSDKFHLKHSQKLARTLITLDRDFLYYKQTSLTDHPGVIVISGGSATPARANLICQKILPTISPNSASEALIVITSTKITKTKHGIQSENPAP
ncbi:DUF5615 family PIN-like protein [Candidatus Amesbacteria bacterium]|nr:DUF5615 family PIN-like protein [Candidatus Amesbacteria bacterium]MBI2587550.1 DUF5615 family PIN-like protein [Candidatus Amesbacteria bacterium]